MSREDEYPMKCPLCKKEPENPATGYCRVHTKALDNMKRAFADWKTAYGDISLIDFLERIIKLPGTGQKSREVAEFLRRSPPGWS